MSYLNIHFQGCLITMNIRAFYLDIDFKQNGTVETSNALMKLEKLLIVTISFFLYKIQIPLDESFCHHSIKVFRI